MTAAKTHTASTAERPPVVAVVGHIDHGKSTLLDYIRKTNVTDKEAGGITQHLSAYEAEHQGRTITFLDTPGHEAFRAMRSRGLEVADVAILVVSAEEGVKPQTLEALKLIEETGIPYVVALTKIDKPQANVERAKSSLIEHGVYLEGMGGNISWTPVSGKTGEGIPELMDLILLAADLEGLEADTTKPAEGLVIESHVDRKRGMTATLIVREGTLASGQCVVSGNAYAPVRIMENFLGTPVTVALPGHPVTIVGFSALPDAGATFRAVSSKKEAEALAALADTASTPVRVDAPATSEEEEEKYLLPLLIKTDVAGAADAVKHELEKLTVPENMEMRVVGAGVGPVAEADVKMVIGKNPGLIIGFNVGIDAAAEELASRQGVSIGRFNVIYKLAEWVAEKIEECRPRKSVEEVLGSARIIKIFSTAKGTTVLGGRVETGLLKDRAEVRIMRKDTEVGRGDITSLQTHKTPVKEVGAGFEFGAMVKTKANIAEGDYVEYVTSVVK